MINSFSTDCPTELTIERHNLTIIASDGQPVVPVNVTTLISFSGKKILRILKRHKTTITNKKLVKKFMRISWKSSSQSNNFSNDLSGLNISRTVKVSRVLGERYDFVINADQPPGAYWIQVRAIGNCGITQVQQLAVLYYAGRSDKPSSNPPTYDRGLPKGVVRDWTRNYFVVPMKKVWNPKRE